MQLGLHFVIMQKYACKYTIKSDLGRHYMKNGRSL